MDANQVTNPYEPSVVKPHRPNDASSRLATTMGVLGFVIGVSPTLYMCWICIASIWAFATIEIPMGSIRPIGVAVSMIGLTFAGLALTPISLGFSWIAKKLGSEEGALFAKLSIGFIAFPLLIGLVTILGIMTICAFRGISIGD